MPQPQPPSTCNALASNHWTPPPHPSARDTRVRNHHSRNTRILHRLVPSHPPSRHQSDRSKQGQARKLQNHSTEEHQRRGRARPHRHHNRPERPQLDEGQQHQMRNPRSQRHHPRNRQAPPPPKPPTPPPPPTAPRNWAAVAATPGRIQPQTLTHRYRGQEMDEESQKK